MPETLEQGEAVFVRSYSARREAIAEVVNPTPMPGFDAVEVQLITDWYGWDAGAGGEDQPRAGEQLICSKQRIQPIRG
jgi:hypothetical protein